MVNFEMDWLKKWALYSPRSVALKDGDTGREVDYQRFYGIVSRLARHLQEACHIASGDRIAVLATNELETLFMFYAAQRLGAILVPINYRLTPREISFVLGDCSPKLLVYQNQFSSVVSQIGLSLLPKNLLLYEGPRGLCSICQESDASSNVVPFSPQTSAETVCMILYTSGTTGDPKGALITQGMIFWNSINTSLRLNLTQADSTVICVPLFHTGAWHVLTTPLIHRGGRVVFMKKFDAQRVLQLIEEEKITVFFGVPTILDMVRNTSHFEEARLDSVRYAIVGGEPMPIELIKAWEEKNIPVRQGYGLTEFGPNVFSLNEEDSVRKIGSIGFPNFYVDAKVVDENGRELGDEQTGELVLRGPACSPGYWNNLEATAQTIRDGWLHTGDLVRRDREGYYYVVGRKKDMFISGGENVYPAEVEKFLRTHEKIHEAAVVGVSDPQWGEVGRAFVTLRPGEKMSEQDLLAFCQGKLAKYKTPKYFHIISEMPRGESGKILKRSLLESQLSLL